MPCPEDITRQYPARASYQLGEFWGLPLEVRVGTGAEDRVPVVVLWLGGRPHEMETCEVDSLVSALTKAKTFAEAE